MPLIGGGETMRKARDMLTIGEADSEMSPSKDKNEFKKRRKNFRRRNMELVWL
jgi:hypothetical protein